MNPAAVLRVEDLTLALRHDPSRILVNKGTLSVFPGSITALVGGSGSGKSLTCLAVLDLLPPEIRFQGGRIELLGKDRSQLSPETLRSLRGTAVASVFQNPMSCFDPIVSLGGHFRETLEAHGTLGEGSQREAALRALAEVGFDHPEPLLRAYPFQLSGGMLQRVMIALALLFRPALLLADEPTTDLDTHTQVQVLDLLDMVRRRHRTGILLVTHDLSVTARLADTVVVIHHGVIEESGPAGVVFETPRSAYARELLKAHRALSAEQVS